MDHRRKRRQTGAEGSQDLAKPSSAGGEEWGGSSRQQKRAVHRRCEGRRTWSSHGEVSSGFLLRIRGKTPAGSPKRNWTWFKIGHQAPPTKSEPWVGGWAGVRGELRQVLVLLALDLGALWVLRAGCRSPGPRVEGVFLCLRVEDPQEELQRCLYIFLSG